MVDWRKGLGRFLDELESPGGVRDESFRRHILQRLAAGEIEYGHKGFEYAPYQILKEMMEEAIDIPSYGYILVTRLRDTKRSKYLIERAYQLCRAAKSMYADMAEYKGQLLP